MYKRVPQSLVRSSGGKGGLEIAESESLSIIFAISEHFLNSADVNNYFPRSERQWFCLDATAKDLLPFSTLETSDGAKFGPNPRLDTIRDPSSFYSSLCALVLTKPMSPKMIRAVRRLGFGIS